MGGGSADLFSLEADHSSLREVAKEALKSYDVQGTENFELINVSENATYLIRSQEGRRHSVLRVHRLNYHPRDEIDSELSWIDALRRDLGVRTPVVIPNRSGVKVTSVESARGETRHCVMFEFIEGREPGPSKLERGFVALGELSARMHEHSRQWQRPAKFKRFRWDIEAAFGPTARWGSWRDGIGVGVEEERILLPAQDAMIARLEQFGSGAERFGLIHADMRLANLLVSDDGATTVIDFDDCGMGWYLYDFGSAVSFMEHEPIVPLLMERWCEGYEKVTPLSAYEREMLWTFVMFRRLLLLGWIGSHQGVPTAQELAASFASQTCELAERYLAMSSSSI